MLHEKKILLGISGSIAAYKSIQIVRLLVKQGAQVKVITTPAAKDFVSPLVLSTLSKNEVLTDMFSENSWANHVQLGRWADAMLLAPLSCNTLSKIAVGMCDNLLLSVYLSTICPVIAAPAMDEDMWHHPATRRNIEQLRQDGITIISPGNGELASGLFGDGRMEEPEHIITFLQSFFSKKNGALSGKKVLITAGPTHEAIDPVRFIGNHSSAKMGISLANECYRRGAEVTLILGPVQQAPHLEGIYTIHVISADDMYNACHEHFKTTDIALMAAAVADYKPETKADKKIKKQENDTPQLKLVKTKDILKSLGTIKKNNQVLLGFALETDNEKNNALEKLQTKNADFIVLNSLKDGNIFGSNTNKIAILSKDGTEKKFDTKSKAEAASDIIDTILQHIQQ